jgi:hypothetical protein
MEAVVISIIPIVIKKVTDQLREDLLHMLMGTKCCKWSKNKIKKLHSMLAVIDIEMEEMQERVRSVSQSIIPQYEEEPTQEDIETFELNIKRLIDSIFGVKQITEI